MKDHQITAATAPLVIGDREFQASPLTDKDHSELDLWIQGRIIRMARASCEGCTPEEREETMQFAMDKAASSSWMTNLSYFSSVEGAARLAWQMIKKNHDITPSEVARLFVSNANVTAIADVFKVLHPALHSDEKSNGKTVKNEKSRRQKQKSTGH